MNSNESNIITYNTPDEKASVALYTRDGKVWLDDTIQLCHLADAKSDVQSKKILHHSRAALKIRKHSVLLRWSVDGVFATTLHRINAFIFSEILGRDGIMESFRLIMDFLEVNTSTIWRIQHLIFSFI